MEQLERVIVAFKGMDQHAKDSLVDMAERYLARWPEVVQQPQLRLVASKPCK